MMQEKLEIHTQVLVKGVSLADLEARHIMKREENISIQALTGLTTCLPRLWYLIALGGSCRFQGCSLGRTT